MYFFYHFMELIVWTAINNVMLMIGIIILYFIRTKDNKWVYLSLGFNYLILLFCGYLVFVFINAFNSGNGSGRGMVLFTWDDLNQRLEENSESIQDGANTSKDGIVDTANTVKDGIVDTANTVKDGIVDTGTAISRFFSQTYVILLLLFLLFVAWILY